MLSSIQCHFGLFGLLGGTVPVPRAFLVLKGWLRNMQLACFFSRSPGRRLLATGDTFWKMARHICEHGDRALLVLIKKVLLGTSDAAQRLLVP